MCGMLQIDVRLTPFSCAVYSVLCKFLERKQASERKKVNRMVYELSRLGYAVSLPA